jgi:hypothetical protein
VILAKCMVERNSTAIATQVSNGKARPCRTLAVTDGGLEFIMKALHPAHVKFLKGKVENKNKLVLKERRKIE